MPRGVAARRRLALGTLAAILAVLTSALGAGPAASKGAKVLTDAAGDRIVERFGVRLPPAPE